MSFILVLRIHKVIKDIVVFYCLFPKQEIYNAGPFLFLLII